MAKMTLPDPLSRRHLLEAGLETTKALALAKAYLEDGREVEAIDFLSAAHADSNSDARDALVELQRVAIERGDVFLMRSASEALGEEPVTSAWRALAEAALSAGRSRDAETAQRLATVGG
jgi:hypothetical protein